MSRSFKETRLTCADSGFFDLFSFPLLEGNPSEQLKAPNTIVLSRKMANKYFENESALNKSLILNGAETYKITGFFEDMPENSHLQFDFLLSMSTILDHANNNSWTSNNFYTYYELRDDANLENVINKINQKSDAELAIVLNIMMNGKTLEEFKAEGGTMDFFMQPLEDVYLKSDFTVDIGRMGNRNYVILFGLIAVFIIILASINFMNLSTARSANRGKEVGVRKVLGSYRSNLVGQFLTESILLSVFSFLVGLFLVVLLLPYFNELTGKQLVLPLSNPV
ncbi:ABC transporter permease, partial [Marivirga lumbricoides]